jgi:four helix bundle protein
VRFLSHARGSLAEIETQVLIAEQRKYLTDATAAKLSQQLDELGRILSGLINSLKDREGPQDAGLRTQD